MMSMSKDYEHFKPSLWMKIFDYPMKLFDKLTGGIFNGPYYALQGNAIIAKLDPFSSKTIDANNIKSWMIIPQMGFDFIQLEFQGGEVELLKDKHNDLITALNTVAKTKKVGNEFDWL